MGSICWLLLALAAADVGEAVAQPRLAGGGTRVLLDGGIGTGGRVDGAVRRREQPAPRADADGDEESEEQPGLDEQLRALLSRMGTDANAAVPVAA